MQFTLVFLCLVLVTALAYGDETVPFVAGFDRFARHHDVDRMTAGRLLLSELSCTACHASDAAVLEPKRGPDLSHAGSRLDSQWMADFLTSPNAVNPGTTMPNLLHGRSTAEGDRIIDGLVAYLSSLRGPFAQIEASGRHPVPNEFWSRGDAERGEDLYHSVGCVACHEPDRNFKTQQVSSSSLDQRFEQLDAEELAEMGLAAAARRVDSVPQANLADKYSAKSLTFFLLDPALARPSGRMPAFKLTAVEAADLAAYLLKRDSASSLNQRTPLGSSDLGQFSSESVDDAKLIERGRVSFSELGCIQCHRTEITVAAPSATRLAELNITAQRSCLHHPAGAMPDYALDAKQIESLTKAIEAAQASNREEPVDTSPRLQLRLLQLNCLACHQRDQLGGVGRYRQPYFETVEHVDLGDEGRLPPPLTGVGRKLTPAWFQHVLQGTGDIRPHLTIRMPRYPDEVISQLPEQFAAVDAIPLGKRASHAGAGRFTAALAGDVDQTELVEAGRQLFDSGCVQCHELRGYSLPGVIGVDLAGIDQRVRREWFHDFVFDPGSLKRLTRMPTFFPNGATQSPEILSGNADWQIAAMWTYLAELDAQPLPEKIEQARSADYELKPVERPLILRTFMKGAGTQAIAVGFPAGSHYAFDAEQSRLAMVWSGRFLDSQATWMNRFAPPVVPLGEPVITLPDGPTLAVLSDATESWPKFSETQPSGQFEGYRLDDEGIPTMIYRSAGVRVEDRIEPGGNRKLRRLLRVTRLSDPAGKVEQSGRSPTIWLRLLTAQLLTRESEHTMHDEQDLRVTLTGDGSTKNLIRQQDGGSEWIVPISWATHADSLVTSTIELTYQW